jgi:flagellar motor protein MotB
METGLTLKKQNKADDSISIDSPYYRHFVKNYDLDFSEKAIIASLLLMTKNMSAVLKTSYKIFASASGISASDVYHGLASLQRKSIIKTKPDGDYFLVSFSPIPDEIEEISLIKKHGREIKELKERLKLFYSKDFIEKQDLFDLIYPLIGKVVIKKIQQALSALVKYVNRKLDNMLSYDLWKYRFKAKISGVPLSEIILKESLPFYVNEIFIIDKTSGILLSYASRKGEESIEEDLIGSMLIAVNDFIQTSFKKSKTQSLNQIQFGDKSIYVCESSYFYAAVVTFGTPSSVFFAEFDNVAYSIHTEHRNELKKFSGEMNELESIKPKLTRFINEKNALPNETKETSYFKVKALGVILLILVAFFISSSIYRSIKDSRLKNRIITILNRTVTKNRHYIQLYVKSDKALLKGYASSDFVISEILAVVRSFKEINKVSNKIVVVSFDKIKNYETSLNALRSQLESLQIEIVRAELEKYVIQFSTGSFDIRNDQKLKLKKAFEILNRYVGIKIDIVAFSDNIGTFSENKRLAEARIASVKKYLVTAGISASRIAEMAFNPELIKSDPRLSKYQSERGVMMFARFNSR